MNSSLVTADVTTHLKIVAVALLAVILVMWIAVGARMARAPGSLSGPRLGLSSVPLLPASAPLAHRPSAIVHRDRAA
jgi:hypothetical protein